MSSGDESDVEWAVSPRRRDVYNNAAREETNFRHPGPRRTRRLLKPHKYETFHYEPLPKQRGAIRLLKLVPSSTENPHIECELVLQPLGDGTTPYKYEALSWCWGTDTDIKDIHIRKDRKLYRKGVSPNLFAALKALRHTVKDRYLWIDAVCINQENLLEKNHQVEMMYDIYGCADRVCIWLGEENKSSQMALRFIKHDVLQLQNFDELCSDGNEGRNWRALLELMQRPWFSRRWVVQEIALAKKAVIYCGQDKISWKKFAIAVELFVEVETATHRLSEVMRKDSKHHHVPRLFDYVSALGASLLVEATDRLFRDYREEHASRSTADDDDQSSDSDAYSDPESRVGSPVPAVRTAQTGNTVGARVKEVVTGSTKNNMRPLLSLEYLVSSLAIFNTTVPHDTIYALLAISKDTTPRAARTDAPQSSEYARAGLELFTQRKKYNVDYELPYVDVCKDFIEFAIQRSLQIDHSRALDVICRPWATEQKDLDRRARAALKQKQSEEKESMEQIKRSLLRQTSLSNTQQQKQQPQNVRNEVGAYPKIGMPAGDAPATVDRRDLPLPSWVPQLSGAPYGMFQQPGVRGYKMSRKNADPLVGSPGSIYKSYSAAETKRVDTKTLKFRKRSDLEHYSMYVRGFQLDEIRSVEQVARNGQIPKEWAELAGWMDAKGTPPDAFWRTLVADRGRDGKNPPVYYSRACEETFKKGGYESGAVNTTDLIDYERNSVVSQFCRRVQAVTWNRALVRTDKGRLGLVSKDVKEGDLVCILYGLSVPIILRQSARKEDEVFEKELGWELNFLVQTVRLRWTQYKTRKLQHERRKRKEMAQQFRQWMEMTAWARMNCTRKLTDGEWTKKGAEEYLSSRVTEAIKEFGVYRVQRRNEEWLAIKRRMKQEKNAKGSIRSHGKQRMDEIIKKRSEKRNLSEQGHQEENEKITTMNGMHGTSTSSTLATEQNIGSADGLSGKPTTPTKRLVDWWEFEYMLKVGRRWKEIVKEKKEKLREEHEKRANEELEKKRNELCKGGRQQTGQGGSDRVYEKVNSRDKKEIESTARSASKSAGKLSRVTTVSFESNVGQTYAEPDRFHDELKDGEVPPEKDNVSLQDVEALDDAIAGAEEQSDTGSGDGTVRNSMVLSRGTTMPRTMTPPPPNETDAQLPSYDKIRPSWIKKAEREALEKAKARRRAQDGKNDSNDANCKNSAKRALTKEEEKERDDAIKGFKEGLKQRLGEDGYFSYELLGECYIHGFMDGEAMLYQNEGDEEDNDVIPSMVFEIR